MKLSKKKIKSLKPEEAEQLKKKLSRYGIQPENIKSTLSDATASMIGQEMDDSEEIVEILESDE